MKTLSIICGLALLMAFVTAPAFPMSFQLDLDQDSPLDYETEVTIMISDTVQVDIWLTDYPDDPAEAAELKAVDYYFYWNTDRMDYVSASTDVGTWPLNASTVKSAPGGLLLGVMNSSTPFYPSSGIDGKSVMLHTIILNCKATGDGVIEVSLDNKGEGPPGAVYDKDGWDYYPDEATGTISCESTSGTTTTTIPQGITTTTTITLSSTTSPSSTTTINTTSTTTTERKLCLSELIYGEYSEEVEILRYIRNDVLNHTPEGRELIRLYYKWSPVIVKAMGEEEELKEDIEEMIDGVLGLIREEVE